jgi:hypothetical protein
MVHELPLPFPCVDGTETMELVVQLVHSDHRPMFRLLAATGLRRSELLALEVRHLHLAGDQPHVKVRQRTRWQKGKGQVLGPLKSRHARRDLPIPLEVADELQARLAGREPGALAFAGLRGPYDPHHVHARVLAPACEEAGVEWAGFHTFRHTIASRMFASTGSATTPRRSRSRLTSTCWTAILAVRSRLGGFGETIGETHEARRSAARAAWGKIALDARSKLPPSVQAQRPTGIRSPLVRPLTWYPRRLAYKAYELTHPHKPWLAQGAVRFLDRELPRDGIGLEWGSGRSTAWLGQRLTRLTSVESSERWYQRMRERVNANVDLRYVPLEHDKREHRARYVAVVEGLGPLDFALVDGRYRQACILAVLPALRPGALLAVDNTNWLSEAEWGVPSDWPLIHRSANVMTETSVWRKPGG